MEAAPEFWGLNAMNMIALSSSRNDLDLFAGRRLSYLFSFCKLQSYMR
jgi:hypothetical protein